MKKYIEIELDIYMFELQDIIRTSPTDPDELPPVLFG